jgi:hypothetical protein
MRGWGPCGETSTREVVRFLDGLKHMDDLCGLDPMRSMFMKQAFPFFVAEDRYGKLSLTGSESK